MKGLKCRFWLYTAKKQKGLSPLHCRILANGKKFETSLGIKLKEEEWNEKKRSSQIK
ncbi:Arm DNA-binding domain-containing protein [Edaphocola flava]|uniref:Arm DNA-binding domain-containing protein n=1 Tax=Edaphocola flava TaxID=2499629 RepID=UPI00100B2667|nr:Arm DNA-binding domain-containing protein [Edaphocola flava]